MRARNANGFSGWGRVSARPDRRPSPPPRVHTTVRSQRVTLHWGAARGGVGHKAAIGYYQVTRGTHGADRHNLSADARSHVFSGLTNGVRYRFYVRAWNRISYGRWSRVSARPHS